VQSSCRATVAADPRTRAAASVPEDPPAPVAPPRVGPRAREEPAPVVRAAPEDPPAPVAPAAIRPSKMVVRVKRYTTRFWDCCKPHCGWPGNVPSGVNGGEPHADLQPERPAHLRPEREQQL